MGGGFDEGGCGSYGWEELAAGSLDDGLEKVGGEEAYIVSLAGEMAGDLEKGCKVAGCAEGGC